MKKLKHLSSIYIKFKKINLKNINRILDSEWSDECIDFTMLCFFFFLCLCTRERVEIMLEFQTLGVVSDS